MAGQKALLAGYGDSPEDEPREESFARNRRWAKPGPYITKLSTGDEQEFQSWAKQHPDLVAGELDTPTPDYDVRGRWLAEKRGDPEAKLVRNEFDGKLHASDKWKTPYDAVFSRESIYATPEAPHWQGDRLVANDGTLIADETPKPPKKEEGSSDRSNGFVPMIGPDGSSALMAPDRVHELMMQGAVPGLVMRSPDGQIGVVRFEDAEHALASGGTLLQNDGSEYAKGEEPVVVGHNASGQPIWGSRDRNAEADQRIRDHERTWGLAESLFPGATLADKDFLMSFGGALKDAATGIAKLLDPRLTDEEKRLGLDHWYDRIAMPAYRMAIPQIAQAQDALQKWNEGQKTEAIGHALAAAVPFVGPMAAGAGEQVGKQLAEGNMGGALGTTAGTLAVTEADPAEILKSAKELSGAARDAARRTWQERITPTKKLDRARPGDIPLQSTGQPMTARERWAAANEMGVNLDQAQATGAGVPAAIKRVTEYSLPARERYEDSAYANIHALQQHAANLQDTIAPRMGQAEFGDAAKQALLEHQANLNKRAGDLYEALDERLGDKMPNVADIRDAAQKIIDDNAGYYEKHPELLKGPPGKAWSIIENLSGGKPEKPKTEETGLVDASGKPITREVPAKTPAPDSWTDLHRLRSDLLDLYRSPEFTGDRPTGWLKQMVGVIDQTMNDGEKTPGLTEADQRAFRSANSLYERMKDTYDNTSSPFYHIVRADPTTAGKTLVNMTPENVLRFREAAGDLDRDDLAPQLDRQIVSSLIDPYENGAADLRNFASRWDRTRKQTLGQVLTPDQLDNLSKLASVSRTVYADANPSGTAKTMQPVDEAAGALRDVKGVLENLGEGHPFKAATTAVVRGAAPVAQAVFGRWMTKPESVAAAMEPRKGVDILAHPVDAAAGAVKATGDAAAQAIANSGDQSPLATAVKTAGLSQNTQPPRDRFAEMTRQRNQAGGAEGVSTPPNEGQVASTTTSEPNEVHDPAREASALQANQQKPGAVGAPEAPPSRTPSNVDIRTGASSSGQPSPQAKLEAPEGATHSVHDPNTDALIGHIVDGAYVPLEEAAVS